MLTAKASAAPRRFIPARAQASGRLLGATLAGVNDRATTAKLAFLCGLGLGI